VAQEEANRSGGDRQKDQEKVLREGKQPAHTGYDADTAPAANDGIAGNVEQEANY